MFKLLNKVKETKEIEITEMIPNEWNPNVMPTDTMILLAYCMLNYGVVFPVLVFWNPEKKKYQIIDGYHRWKTISDLSSKKSKIYKGVSKHLGVKEIEINKLCPCVILDLTIAEAMELTVLMNRIKGAHKVSGMADIVSELTGSHNIKDTTVALNLGMKGEEFIRLKAQKGERVVAEAFKNHKPSKAWEIR